MLTFVSIVHVVLCVFMIFVILLQPGKDAGMGAALGGGAATSAFGGRGAVTFLTKLTAACAISFFLTSLGLSFVGVKSSVAEEDPNPPGALAPGAEPAPPSMETSPAPQTPSVPAEPGPAPGTEAVPAEKLPPTP